MGDVSQLNRSQPSFAEGKTEFFGFRVDEPIPVIAIPLMGDEAVTVDLGAVYDFTFSEDAVFGSRLVDYRN